MPKMKRTLFRCPALKGRKLHLNNLFGDSNCRQLLCPLIGGGIFNEKRFSSVCPLYGAISCALQSFQSCLSKAFS
jgi:hypothetical protein